jgi:hypothetical protein
VKPDNLSPKRAAPPSGALPSTQIVSGGLRQFDTTPQVDNSSSLNSTMPNPFGGTTNADLATRDAVNPADQAPAPAAPVQPVASPGNATPSPADASQVYQTPYQPTASDQMPTFPNQNPPAAFPGQTTDTASPAAPAFGGQAYLDSIATPVKQPNPLLSAKMLVIFGSLVAAIVIFIVIAAVSGGQKGPSAGTLGAQLSNLQTLLDYGDKNGVGRTETRMAVAEAQLVLNSRVYDLKQVYGSGFSKPDKTAKAANPSTTIIADLDQAKSVSNLETAYPEELRDYIARIEKTVRAMRAETTSKKTRDTLDKTAADLQIIADRLPAT